MLAQSASRNFSPRVVNISSLAGIIGVPNMSACVFNLKVSKLHIRLVCVRYCASKWALEGWSDSIRREFRSWGIKVSALCLGSDVKYAQLCVHVCECLPTCLFFVHDHQLVLIKHGKCIIQIVLEGQRR